MFTFWKLNVLELLRCVQLRFVTLCYVMFMLCCVTLCCFTLCSNIITTGMLKELIQEVKIWIYKKNLLLWDIFALMVLDPDSESGFGSTDPIESGSNPDPDTVPDSQPWYWKVKSGSGYAWKQCRSNWPNGRVWYTISELPYCIGMLQNSLILFPIRIRIRMFWALLDPHPHPFVKGTDTRIRIRIRTKMTRIRIIVFQR
jgi:hypothetical protein